MIEEFQVIANTVADLKGIVNLREEMLRLRRAGAQVKGVMGDLDSKIKKSGIDIKAATRAFTPFRMELLSVMFGAQMLAGALWGLLNPALTTVGIFELFTTVLEVLFLPIALLLLDWLLPIAQAFMDLDPAIQMVIGAFVLILGVVATAISLFGSLGLFIIGMKTTFGFLSASIGLIVGAVVLAIGVIIGLIALWKNWENISWGVKLAIFAIGVALAILLAPITTTIAVIIGIGAAIVGVMAIIKNWGPITAWLKDVWGKIAGFFSSLVTDPMKEKWQAMVDWIKSLWDGVKEIWGKVTGGVKNVWGKITGKGSRQMGGYIPHSGLYKMHAGETVTSNYENNFSPTVNVNASSNVDIEMLKKQLNQDWATEFGRLSRA